MEAINNLTQFLAGLAEQNEKTKNGVYKMVLRHPLISKMDALDPDLEEKIKSAITAFIANAFVELIQDAAAEYTILLMEIKNQAMAAQLGTEQPDMEKLEQMASSSADKFRVLVEVVKNAIPDVNWPHIAERIIEAGKKQTKKKEHPFSDN